MMNPTNSSNQFINYHCFTSKTDNPTNKITNILPYILEDNKKTNSKAQGKLLNPENLSITERTIVAKDK